MGTLIQDARYAIRMLGKNPGFTLIAVLTLGLGIGANTAIFSVVNGVLLRPLPYPQPNQLVALSENNASFESSSISYPNFLDWQRGNSSFASMAAYRSDDFSITGSGEAERVRIGMVSAGFFEILGVHPVRGRLFTKEEDRLGTAPVALISAGLWQRKFGAASDILGKRITMNGDGYTVIGVVPATFHLESTNFDRPKDVYIPIGQNKDPLFYDRTVHPGMRAIGRLKPGVTLAAVQAEMDRIARDLAAAYPDADKGAGIGVVLLKENIVGDVQPFLLILLGAVGFVLLIACVNVANLQLSHSTARAREFAIRAALGASQSRVIRQLLTESILLALAGGALGLCLATWGTQAALQALPETVPRAQDVGLDARVLIFTLAASMMAGVMFGLVPALKTSRPDLHATLKESGRGASGARHRAQSVFVVIEMAMALVLLTGAGLMIRSLVGLWSVNPGFNPRGVLTFAVSLSPSLGVNAATSRSAIREMDEKLKNIPGVEAVSSTGGALPMNGDNELPFWLEGQPKPANTSEMNQSLFYMTEPGYLSTMEIPLLRGRNFTPDDNERSQQVMVVDENFARQFFPNADPIGKRIHIGIIDMEPEVVGIVGHVKHWGLDRDGDAKHPILAQAYINFLQIPDRFWAGPPQAEVILRTKGSPADLVPTIREAIEKLNGENVIYETKPLEEIVADSLANRRFSMVLLSVFAALALLLSSIGIYGVISYVVAQRTHEIGIRIALGAQRRDVLQLMLGEGMKMALVGVAIGVAVALGLTRLMVKMLFSVSATDPATFAAVATVLTGVALAACYIPARRAMRVDPIVALRYE
ncbi:MAG TPA: ABC transporter permease [Candidatus Limnocylindria bacterium]|nr:ABC transporter permease [Candidatus Limnocylindria bacterium]